MARSEGEAQREKLDLQRLRFSSLYIALCAAVWICSACALAIMIVECFFLESAEKAAAKDRGQWRSGTAVWTQ